MTHHDARAIVEIIGLTGVGVIFLLAMIAFTLFSIESKCAKLFETSSKESK